MLDIYIIQSQTRIPPSIKMKPSIKQESWRNLERNPHETLTIERKREIIICDAICKRITWKSDDNPMQPLANAEIIDRYLSIDFSEWPQIWYLRNDYVMLVFISPSSSDFVCSFNQVEYRTESKRNVCRFRVFDERLKRGIGKRGTRREGLEFSKWLYIASIIND